MRLCARRKGGISILRQILAPVAGGVAVAPVRGGKDFVKAAPFRKGFLTLMPRLAAEDAPLFQKGGQ